MTHALNLTLPLKQDRASKDMLRGLAENFANTVQPEIERALKESRIVHFARVLVIDDKYIQVITEYEGDHQEYTEFFRDKLTPVFAAIFALAEEAPDVNDTNKFWDYAKKHNVHSLGMATDGALDFSGSPAGWLFSAYDHKTVRTLQDALVHAG
ncbi:MAG: hypothetical protein E5V25_14705 [Mesorhizobium sp.]|uniref:hypothetical protein n=1 Tax=unclassified Mesorhizobium TaxID=325217 RepID=UPI000FCAA1A2|nr:MULTISPECIES: hypothetical protein [unclassified Mesorhizobium]RUV58070.1 hypothetical protein EOA85_14520 [Mesorhizobium sp. M5C.F.Ca.IN.020.29.1.1]RWB04818.1 MAG: hypothetical protein EOQ33_07590 [Mesorhizobium sp.]RWC24221.1 MAG: hypothetical protein EOS51_04555 [Mesorhizobium sp.]RWD85471.1 MAG: hypothetical protein EOS48_05125 [Mesorhizobium sp.]RWE53208.1 MAG: hypothetical protein EOS67_28175 [Mesorhizobium sp.]